MNHFLFWGHFILHRIENQNQRKQWRRMVYLIYFVRPIFCKFRFFRFLEPPPHSLTRPAFLAPIALSDNFECEMARHLEWGCTALALTLVAQLRSRINNLVECDIWTSHIIRLAHHSWWLRPQKGAHKRAYKRKWPTFSNPLFSAFHAAPYRKSESAQTMAQNAIFD